MSSPETRQELKSARLRAALSVIVNLCLALGKGWAGYVADSTALLSDAIHSATDVLASAAVLVGLWVAGKKHPSFPYGLYKAETVATLVTSIVVIVAAYEIGRQAMFGSEQLPDVAIALPVAVISLLVALSFGLMQLRAGKRLNSPALLADARDYLADSMSTGVVLFGLLASYFGFAVDRWAALVVSIFVFRSGGQLLALAIRDLLDASIDRETEREIVKLVEDAPRVSKVKRCLSRTAGGRFIIDMDVIMHTPSHQVADQVADRLEEEIPEKFPRVVMARIRPHFGRGDIVRQMTPIDKPGGDMASHIARAPWFCLETINEKNGKVLREYLENPHWQEERKKGFLVGKWLLAHKIDRLVLPHGTKSTGTAVALLNEAGIEIMYK
jgi:cation diffusion facilitator family transporter